MRKLIGTFSMFLSLSVNAQPKLAQFKATPPIKPVIEKVARDYYQNFNNIKGDTLNETRSTIEFKSKIEPAGSLSTTITKYVDPYSYSWQSTLFQSEDYEEAVAKYKEFYHQLNGCRLTFYDKSSYKLEGAYDKPDEARSFASSILELDSTNRDMELFKVEIALNYSMPNWTVSIMVYEKIGDDKIRPTPHLSEN